MSLIARPFVYIVGAGPGSADLLTFRAYTLIREMAEVVIYDRLISEEILGFIPSHVEKIYAGKAAKCHSMTQEEINQLILSEAEKGRIIVRLKGGDPFIFGRGGEEAECLKQHGIAYEVVPGISAASACSAALGIPLTHRGLASSVRYITGHCQKEAQLDLDWKALADPEMTLVVYMGLAHLKEICSNLIAAGLAAETPAAAIYSATTREQRHCIATLADLSERVAAEQFKSPTLVVIGKVVALAQV